MVDLIYVPGVDSHKLRMEVFLLSLADDARKWWINEGEGKIIVWEELVEKFFYKFYPESYDGEEEINYVVLGEYKQKARILELKRRYFEDYYSDNQYAISIKEDTAYPRACTHQRPQRKQSNTPYLGKAICRIQALWE
ncbi:hypothetical protein Tco_0562187 [Tanacetum coccineum]